MATTIVSSIDLTPFGFTPTETQVYSALLDRGFTSAYALAKGIGIARANVYQALNGLVSKGAAVRVSDSPQVFRPIGPDEILALVSERQAAQLEQLHMQVRARERSGEPATIPFSGRRELGEIVLRTAARARTVTCVANPEVLALLNPVWRKRSKDQVETALWTVGNHLADLALRTAGVVDSALVVKYFGGSAVLLSTERSVALGCEGAPGELHGIWSSDVLLIGVVRAAIEALTES
jgi:sugar-specific transcriptional regulator TrmB